MKTTANGAAKTHSVVDAQGTVLATWDKGRCNRIVKALSKGVAARTDLRVVAVA